MSFKVRFTGERITEESAHYGDFAEAGWIDPNYSKTVLFQDRDDVSVYSLADKEDAVELIRSHIGSTHSDDDETFYALDGRQEGTDYWMYAAHIEEV